MPASPCASASIELLAETAAGDGDSRIAIRERPTVLMVCGVNGTGKTTTIGKLAWHLQRELGLSVLIAAADTYRAAAVEQLETWAERAGCEIVKSTEGGDAGAVAFDAISAAEARRAGRGDHRHGRAPPHPRQPDGRAHQGPPGDLEAARRRAARDPDHDRLDHRPERPAAGEGVRRRGRGHRRRPHQARRHREGRDRAGDLTRARHPGEADRRGGGPGGPAAVRPPRSSRRPCSRIRCAAASCGGGRRRRRRPSSRRCAR